MDLIKKLFSQIKKRIYKSDFTRNVLVLLSGSAVAQGLFVIFAPIITRLFSPDDFGILAVYLSIVSLWSLVASMKYEFAIPLVEDEDLIINLVVLCFLILIAMTLLCLLVVWGWGYSFTILIKSPSIRPYLWFVPLGLFVAGSYQILNYWAMREKYFIVITKTKLVQSIGRIITQISIGIINPCAAGLIFGEILGQGGGISVIISRLKKENRVLLKSTSLHGIKQVAIRFRKLPIISSWSSLLNSSGTQLPQIFLASLYGTHIAGWYALGQRVISAPLALLGQSVAQVYLVEASILAREQPEKLKKLFCETILQMLKIGVLPIMLLAIGGPFLFSLVFGDSWQEAGNYIRLTSFAVLIQFISGPVFQTLTILEKQEWQFFCDLFGLVLIVGATIISKKLFWPPSTTIIIYAISTSLTYISLLAMAYVAIKFRKESNFKQG